MLFGRGKKFGWEWDSFGGSGKFWVGVQNICLEWKCLDGLKKIVESGKVWISLGK